MVINSMKRLYKKIRYIWIYILYLYYTYTNNTYPFWFLYKLNKKTISFALKRSNYIQNKYINLHASKKQEFIDNLFTSQDINYVFKPNNFPYAVDDNIIHYVLWIRPGLIINGTLLNTVIFRHIKLIFKPNPKYSFIKNSVSNKSIPQIEHYHVFISLDHSYNYKI